jgi:hypothetical protein
MACGAVGILVARVARASDRRRGADGLSFRDLRARARGRALRTAAYRHGDAAGAGVLTSREYPDHDFVRTSVVDAGHLSRGSYRARAAVGSRAFMDSARHRRGLGCVRKIFDAAADCGSGHRLAADPATPRLAYIVCACGRCACASVAVAEPGVASCARMAFHRGFARRCGASSDARGRLCVGVSRLAGEYQGIRARAASLYQSIRCTDLASRNHCPVSVGAVARASLRQHRLWRRAANCNRFRS